MKKTLFFFILLFITSYSFGQCPSLTGNTPICPNSIDTYTTQSSKTNYIWTLSGGGTILSGGNSTSNFIEIDWGGVAGNYTITVTFDEAVGNNHR
jgi:hypothetical protein